MHQQILKRFPLSQAAGRSWRRQTCCRRGTPLVHAWTTALPQRAPQSRRYCKHGCGYRSDRYPCGALRRHRSGHALLMLAPAVKAGTYGRCHIPCICTTNSAVRIAQSRTKARTSESRRRSCGMKSRRFPPASCCDRFAEQGLVAWGVQRLFCLKGTK